MKKYLTLLISSTFFAASFAQTYSISPVKIFKEKIDVTKGFLAFDIKIKNETAKPMRIEWNTLLVSVPTGWDFSICDYGVCYITIPDSARMKLVEPGKEGFIKLDIFPNGIAGNCNMLFKIRDSANASVTDTIGFDINGVIGTGIADAQSAGVSIYPNPVSSQLFVNTGRREPMQFALYDFTGKLTRSGSLNLQSVVDLAGLQAGIYSLILVEATGERMQHRFLKQ